LTDFIIAALIYHASLSSQQHSPNAPLCWGVNEKNKGIRARFVDLPATKGNWINKGCMLEAVRKAMLSRAELLGN
jgi:hypothetical protein